MNSDAKAQSPLSALAGAVAKAALIMLMHPVWPLLSQLNLKISPGVPWAAIVILFLLYLLWQFLDGRIGPRNTSDARRALLKWKPAPGPVWIWALTAGGLAMISMAMIETHSFQVAGVTTTNSLLAAGFGQYSLLTGTAFAVVSSLLAALVEESAFRGYMQSDLEKRFGLPPTIVMVALAFAIFHLYGRTAQQWIAGFADWTVISVIFSLLVVFTGSIVPAVVCHFVIDLALFSLDWFDDPLEPLRAIVPGIHLSWGAVIFCFSTVASILAFWKLARVSSVHLGKLAA
jgi:membrane protease YdiL (CAAX protease family)